MFFEFGEDFRQDLEDFGHSGTIRPKISASRRYYDSCFMHNVGGIFDRR